MQGKAETKQIKIIVCNNCGERLGELRENGDAEIYTETGYIVIHDYNLLGTSHDCIETQ